MKKEDFLLLRASLQARYVDKLVKYFITAFESELRNVAFIANVYELTIYNSVDHRTIYKSFNKNMEIDVLNALKLHFQNNNWSASFTISKDEDSERSYIVCAGRFLI